MNNLQKVAEKIDSFQEEIIVFSDADMDGVASALILQRTLQALSKDFSCFFADKEKRGYGLKPAAVDLFSDKDSGLIITLDCGISNFEGIKKAKREGFEVIVIDHHEPHDRLPEADLIVCPKNDEEDYFKDIPNAVIALRLGEELLDEKRDDFYEFASLAITGDMMPHKETNAEILGRSLPKFPVTKGMKSFQKVLGLQDARQLLDKAVPFLNVTEMVAGSPESFLFFDVENDDYREDMAQRLIEKHEKRGEKVKEIVEKGIEIDENNSEEILFFGDEDWSNFLLGKVASKLVQKLKKPVFVYRKSEPARGSVRVPEGLNAVEAMEDSEDILDNYGGHPPAAGFTVESENLEEFKNNLIQYFKECEK